MANLLKLVKMTVSELRELARKHLGSGHSRLKTKTELIAALKQKVSGSRAKAVPAKTKSPPKTKPVRKKEAATKRSKRAPTARAGAVSSGSPPGPGLGAVCPPPAAPAPRRAYLEDLPNDSARVELHAVGTNASRRIAGSNIPLSFQSDKPSLLRLADLSWDTPLRALPQAARTGAVRVREPAAESLHAIRSRVAGAAGSSSPLGPWGEPGDPAEPGEQAA